MIALQRLDQGGKDIDLLVGGMVHRRGVEVGGPVAWKWGGYRRHRASTKVLWQRACASPERPSAPPHLYQHLHLHLHLHPRAAMTLPLTTETAVRGPVISARVAASSSLK